MVKSRNKRYLWNKSLIPCPPDVAAAPEDPASHVLVTGHQGAGEAGDGGPGLSAVIRFISLLRISYLSCHVSPVHKINPALLEIYCLALQPVLNLPQETIQFSHYKRKIRIVKVTVEPLFLLLNF